MKTLYLHIGSHKTASTSIQTAMLKNQPLLRENGLYLFCESPVIGQKSSANAHRWLEKPFSFYDHASSDNSISHISTNERKLDKLFTVASQLSGDVIISAEGFSWVFSPLEIENIHRSASKKFDEIKVIVYLRRQDHQVVSHRQQASKSIHSPAHLYYGDDESTFPRVIGSNDNYLNYYKRVMNWVDVFGSNQVIVKIFEPSMLNFGDPVKDFFSVLGVTGGVESGHDNVSHSFERIKIGHLLNKAKVTGSLGKLVRQKADSDMKLRPSRSDAIDFYSKFQESNQQLNKALQIREAEDLFSDDFSTYPEISMDQWNEESASNALLSVLQILVPFNNFDFEDINRAATQLKDIDQDLSRRLSLMASSLNDLKKY